MTTLIIARHGNTFESFEKPTRVGARTDLPLVESGKEQARKIGEWLKQNKFFPEITYCSELKRTQETAHYALANLGYSQPVFSLSIFNEIDYGPDEDKTEEKVIARIGAQAIRDWDERGIVPQGWKFDPQECIQNWKNFATQILNDNQNDAEDIILVVTSNGIARFAPYLTDNFEDFANNNKIKLSTGAIGVLKYQDNKWIITDWNIKP